MTTKYIGIDYGLGRTNIDEETSIRYGVIPQNELLQSWNDEFESFYGLQDCPLCGGPIDTEESFPDECPLCDADLNSHWDYLEPISYRMINDEYEAESDELGDIFIFKAPYFTYAQFCSPCAPGACHLSQPLDEPSENNKCYCFGHDWFEDGQAPYPVYCVETEEMVQPKNAVQDVKENKGEETGYKYTLYREFVNFTEGDILDDEVEKEGEEESLEDLLQEFIDYDWVEWSSHPEQDSNRDWICSETRRTLDSTQNDIEMGEQWSLHIQRKDGNPLSKEELAAVKEKLYLVH